MLLEATERLLRKHGVGRITVSEVAAECGMSQSNAYRFFPSKQALLETAGERWFGDIETQLDAVAASGEPPDKQFVRFVVRQYEMKRERYVADPVLFRAYVELGLANMAVVEKHLARIAQPLAAIMQRLADIGRTGGRDVNHSAALAEVMTGRFRDPVQIMRYAENDSVETAAEVAGIVLAGLASTGRS